MLLNLAINARDAMPDGGALILRVMRVSERVVVQVKDTGVGMSEDVRARIFDPFFTTKQPGQGTGLGLATVFSIVAAHGGTIEAESEEGRGSTFSIALPVAQSVGSLRPGA
jgi:signal transduction histidine kinase